jgi:hypothetical protein
VISNWKASPILIRAAALVTGICAVVMSLIPPLVYIGMVPVIHWAVLMEGFVWRSGPILIVYVVAVIIATLLDPAKRPLTGAALLIATVPATVALMLYGLR